MKNINVRISGLLFIVFFLAACSPHPGTGVWKAIGENTMGIERLVVGFEGRASFVSKTFDNATWHCFWGKLNKTELSMECTPSSNPDTQKKFVIRSIGIGKAELREVVSFVDQSKPLATFELVDENPSPRKK